MKMTVLEMVQSILSDMDSEAVNSISETTEAEQVARILKDTFHNMIATRSIPEHNELLKLTSASDSNFPTHFQYGTNVKEITKVWYKDDDGFYREVHWLDPMDFLTHIDRSQGDEVVSINDKSGGTTLRIRNNANPSYYTSFDDFWIVMDSYKASVDATLQNSKVRAYGTVYPVFTLTDSYTPDIDATMFPYLLAEAKSTAMSLLKGGSDPKIEQAARRQKAYVQNDMYRTARAPQRPKYGR